MDIEILKKVGHFCEFVIRLLNTVINLDVAGIWFLKVYESSEIFERFDVFDINVPQFDDGFWVILVGTVKYHRFGFQSVY